MWKKVCGPEQERPVNTNHHIESEEHVDMELLQISIAEYHERPEVSSGMIRCFATEGPWMCYHKYGLRDIERPDSDACQLGRAFHAAIAIPEQLDDFLEVMPATMPDGEEINLRKKDHRVYKAEREFYAKSSGKEFVTSDEYDKITRMVESVYDNPAAKPYVGRTDGGHEVACISKDPVTGLDLKALADIHLGDTIVDFKTTRFSTADEFVRDAFKRGYTYQAAHYLKCFGAQKFVLIAVRNERPWESMVYVVPKTRIQDAMQSNQSILKHIKSCYDTGSWHSLGYGSEIPLEYEHLQGVIA